MRTKITKLLIFIFLLVGSVSCQKETNQLISANPNESLQLNATATKLIERVVENDGSVDDIIDNASCISIKLPVTVIANGVQIIINSIADYSIVQQNFDQYNAKNLQLVYPIVIILSDYSEVTISNHDELEKYTEKCKEDSITDDIECLDFLYPITLSVYDSNNQIAQTVEIQNDKIFFSFIQQLTPQNIAAINFPISVHLYSGETKVISSMSDLELLINQIKEACD